MNVWNEKSKADPRTIDFTRPWYAYAKQLIQKRGLEKGKAALDIGCGVGEFMEILAGIGIKAMGLDGEPGQVKKLVANGYNVKQADLEAPLPIEDESIDLITSLEVIEHIAGAEKLLREMARVVKSDGHLVISTPNFSCWQNRLRYLKGKPPVNEGVHLRFYTSQTFQRALSDNGWRIIESASYAPYTGLNYIRKLRGKDKKYWVTSAGTESLFAEVLLYLARKE